MRHPRLLLCPLLVAAAALAEPLVTLNEADFRDRVYACWLGKNIGGTLGMPFEGKQQAQNISFYTNLKPGQPAANDDLDLQLLWLKALEENDARVDARILGEYWLKFVPVDWNEYGTGKRNMRLGLLPPLSGEWDNARWKHSNGAWIRSEIWACLAPGCPGLAAKLAREDACVDHGAAEGTLAEIFTAAIESAAFVERDRDKLIALGLAMIPERCGVARAVRAVLEARRAGKDWRQARLDVIEASKDTGWFQAPRNVAYTILGWIYGDGDFGQSLCLAVNCGDDTDCTGATLGSILGIIGGTKAIPARWSEPIGLGIKTVAIRGFQPPKDIVELTDRTVAMARRVLARHQAPVALTTAPTDLRRAGELKLADTATAQALWALSPYRIVWTEPDVSVTLDYGGDPLIVAETERVVHVTATSAAKTDAAVLGAPAGWTVTREATGPGAWTFRLKAPTLEAQVNRLHVEVTGGAQPVRVPLTLLAKLPPERVGADDLALAAKGATAQASSEYAQEPGGAARVIDGILATADDFANRWHSSLATPHPHWIQVKLPQPARLGRVVLRFADPLGYPTSFQGLVLPAGRTELQSVLDVTANKETRTWRGTFEPVLTDTFRLVIRASASVRYPNAAQLSEIELYAAP